MGDVAQADDGVVRSVRGSSIHPVDVVERPVEGEQDAPVAQVEVAPDPRLLRRAGDDRYRPLVAAGQLQVELQQVAYDLEVGHESDNPHDP